ncbi:MAG: hypothetical protein R3F35_08085 [Myxococcota bacterium]
MRRSAVSFAALAACLLGAAVLSAATVFASTVAQAVDDGDAIARDYERGPVRVALTLRPAQPMIGDVIELTLEARAEPEVELLMPAFGEALGRFEIVDFAPSERAEADGTTVARQVYRLQAQRSGRQSIPALRVEFVDRRPGNKPAPEGEDAYEILTERVALDVGTILASDAPLELRPAQGDLARRRFPGVPVWAWLGGALVVVAIAAPFAWRAWLAHQTRQRQRSAYEIARGELDALLARGRPRPDALDAFYVALSLIVRRYLENRFALRSPELTTEEFLAEMGRSPDLARAHQQLLREFLTEADLVKFAGHRPGAEVVGRSIAAAERFLEDTRDLVRLSEAS